MSRNPGPLTTTKKRSLLEVIPERFRSSLLYTSQPVPRTTDPSALSFTKIMSECVQQHLNEWRKNEWDLDGVAFPTLYGLDYDERTDIGIPYTETIVPMAAPPADPRIIQTPLSLHHALRRTYTISGYTKTIQVAGTARWSSPPLQPIPDLQSYGPFNIIGTGSGWAYESTATAKAYSLSYNQKEGTFPATIYFIYKEPTGGHGLSFPPLNFTMSRSELTHGYVASVSLFASGGSGSGHQNPAIASVTIPPHLNTVPSGSYLLDVDVSDYKYGLVLFRCVVLHL